MLHRLAGNFIVLGVGILGKAAVSLKGLMPLLGVILLVRSADHEKFL